MGAACRARPQEGAGQGDPTFLVYFIVLALILGLHHIAGKKIRVPRDHTRSSYGHSHPTCGEADNRRGQRMAWVHRHAAQGNVRVVLWAQAKVKASLFS